MTDRSVEHLPHPLAEHVPRAFGFRSGGHDRRLAAGLAGGGQPALDDGNRRGELALVTLRAQDVSVEPRELGFWRAVGDGFGAFGASAFDIGRDPRALGAHLVEPCCDSRRVFARRNCERTR